MARRPSERWAAHPVLAWLVRVGVLLVPVLASIGAALLVMAALPRPHGPWETTGWWGLVLGAAFLASVAVDRLARRALPLAVLLQLSLVFPDRAPSRLKTARRTGLREIERQVATLQKEEDPGEAARALVSLVGALGQHDKRTRGHSERVRLYVDMLTEQLGLSEDDRARLRWASLLHDIGKLTVPGSILNGGRDIASEEWESLRRHPDEGHRLAAGLMPWLGEWGRCVQEHHERWDGSGYPQGLRGQEISLGARIVSVADAYEVMTANRSYSKAVSPEAARRELAACAGTHFDPMVVRAFLEISLGRLRGVLGPLAFLAAVPLGTLADRAGRAAQTSTGMVAAASVAAISLPAPAVTQPSGPQPSPPGLVAEAPPSALPPVARAPEPVVLPSPQPPAAAPAPARARTAGPVASARPAATSDPEPTPSVPPAAFGRLFLAEGGGFRDSAPTSSTAATLVLRPGGLPGLWERQVLVPTLVQGRPTLVLYERLQPRRGKGAPKATVTVMLLDCPGGSSACRTLSTGRIVVKRQSRGWQARTLRMGLVDALLLPGHTLRLAVALEPHRNVQGLVVGFGGTSAPSRIDIP